MVSCDVTTSRVVPRRHSRWWVVGAAGAAIISVIAHQVFLGFGDLYGLFGNGVDAVVYRHGGATVFGKDDLYTFSLFDTELPFTYPPFAAVVFVGLALVSVGEAQAAVVLVNGILLYLAVMLSWRVLGYRGIATHLVSLGMAIALTWLEPVRMTIWLGQINLLLLVLVLWDLGRPDGSRLRGVGVGIAAGLKLTPAFFVVYAITLRQFRTAAVAGATFVFTVAVGFLVLFDDARTFWTVSIFQSDRIGLLSSPANQSIHGMLARAWPGGTPPAGLWITSALAVAFLGLWCALIAHRRGAHLLSLTVCGLTTPMVSPFSWGHHWVWCVPLTVLALDCARRTTHRVGALVPLAALVPFVAWYWTTTDGVAVIGTFMLRGPLWAESIAWTMYPLVFLALASAVLVTSRRKVDDRRPDLELALESHRGVGGTGRGQPRHRDVVRERCDVAHETALGLGAVEDNPADGTIVLKKTFEVVCHDGGFDNGGIQASVPGAQFQNIPHRNSMTPQRRRSFEVRERRIEVEQ